MNRNAKLVVVIVVVVFSIVSVVAVIVANIRYNAGYESGYSLAYTTRYSEGYDKGYTKGLDDGAGHGYTIRDPTYQEAILFKATDQTDQNTYDEPGYTCTNFAADFKNNAFQVGYRCGYVEIEYPIYAHAIVCFNTIDRGLIFIEPQWDDIVTLTIGLSYSEVNAYETADFDDAVIRYMIVW